MKLLGKKKLCFTALFLLLLFITSGCGKDAVSTDKKDATPTPDTQIETAKPNNPSDDKTEVSGDTLGAKFASVFASIDVTSPNAAVDELLANVETPFQLVKMDVEPGFLNGFDHEIKEFQSGVMFSPMIGSIPFVGYVFEADNPEAFEAALKENANLKWNVCTEADEMVSAVQGNYVFFIMCSNEKQ